MSARPAWAARPIKTPRPDQNISGSDGIIDTLYDILPLNYNKDEFPLAEPYQQLLGDINYDGKVNIDDMFLVLGAWGQTGEPGWIPEDVNNDGVININDIFFILAHWT